MSRFQFKQHPFRIIFSLYFVFILLFAFIYKTPLMYHHDFSFVNAFFLSASAMSVTGLTTVSITDDLTRAGQLVLLFQIQFGGIGIMTILGSMLLLFKRNVSLPYQTLMSFDQNQKNLKSIGKLMMFIFLLTISVEFVGFLCFLPFILPQYDSLSEGLFVAAFHAGSSFTNAGFDLFGNSLFQFSHQPLFILITSLLIFLGVIGFPVILELLSPPNKRLSLYARVNLHVHIFLILIGFFIFLFVDVFWMKDEFSLTQRLTSALFLSVSARNAGLSIMDLHLLSFSSILIMMMLMFIGGAPSSCGGGIRTTTFAVVIMKIWSIIRGKSDVQMFKKSLYEDDVNKAFLVFFSFLGLFFVSLFVLSLVEKVNNLALAFEIMSALSTTGLSMGITDDLSTFSKIWLIILMIIGRTGVIVLIYSFVETKPSSVKYSKESMIVG